MTADTKKPDLGRIGENAFTEVLRVFLSLPVTVRNSSTHGHDSSTRDPIISTVRLAGPRVSGSVEVQLPLAFVAHAFRRLTGFESDARDATAALEDTAGELANMVADAWRPNWLRKDFPARWARRRFPAAETRPSKPKPVCNTDGQTFSARVMRCRSNSAIVSWIYDAQNPQH